MIPAKFDYVRAGSADEAVSLIAEHGAATLEDLFVAVAHEHPVTGAEVA